jgi:hypothetical protein
LDYFEKDNPSFLKRDKFLEIINLIFKNTTRLERDAIIFQVRQEQQVTLVTEPEVLTAKLANEYNLQTDPS